MATPVKFINGSKLLVRLGDGGSPEQFVHPCLINTTRGIEFGSSPNETLVPFCPPDQEEPGWVDRDIDGLTATINGAGVLDTASLDVIWDWYSSALSKNVHVEIVAAGADGGGYFYGAAVLTGFTIGGPGRREKTTFECTIMSDGQWQWADAA